MRERRNIQLFGYRNVLLLSSIIFTLASTPASSTNIVKGDSLNPLLYSTNSSPYGIPYQQWAEKWWQWSFSIPQEDHPRQNNTASNCARGQSGPVWFLADSLSGTVQRTCVIPTGKSILVGLLTGECDRSDPTLHNDQDVRQCATEGNDYGVIGATLDGVQLQNLNQYRIDSGFYNLTIPPDNIYKEKPGMYRAFTNGFFAFLQPLHPGTHDLHLTVSVANPVKPQYNYAADWTYHLIVK
ncbi:hypothetical protein [Nitrososphaera sp. AFS]|uniref:hypothetical protein n=1 Tax=Nitrososphaera sp. AFS TaxID=2301191 RepID=UPI001392396B|nr:hypothetical protein [Nitrososphaera sp. AFS]NAL78697.1 hypothetical protein [Nitrososphaera sp. AFS]